MAILVEWNFLCPDSNPDQDFFWVKIQRFEVFIGAIEPEIQALTITGRHVSVKV